MTSGAPFLYLDGPSKGCIIKSDFKPTVTANHIYYKDTYAIITTVNTIMFRVYFDVAYHSTNFPSLSWMIKHAHIWQDVIRRCDFLKDFEGWFFEQCCKLQAPYPGIRETCQHARSKLIYAEIVNPGARIKVVK